jgi:DNA-binding NtrC family response regulator
LKEVQILIIDDEAEIVHLLSRMFRRNGFIVSSAGTIKDGDQIAMNEEPAIIFLDVNLPDGNGLDALEAIKHQLPTTEVIMMSAFDTIENRERASRLGAYTFLSKPFSMKPVLEMVEQLKTNN